MFVSEIIITDDLKLIEPDVDRDAQLGYEWLSGEVGKKTMALMGNVDFNGTTLEIEKERIRDFIQKSESINWMISSGGDVVGSVWLDRKKGEATGPAWWLSIMIGDTSQRGKGIGVNACSAAIDWAFTSGDMQELHARHIAENQISQKLLTELGFKENGQPKESEGNIWQNYELTKEAWLSSRSLE